MWKIVTNDHFLNQDKIFPSAQPTSSFSPMSDVDIYVEQNPDSRYLLAKGCLRGG